ncbi:MAG: hypothetical protein IJ682_00550 [Lachnospiraceae bacterium]|nr:hypothetical protein [Lachnospiraceae bacterium]
MVRDIDLSRYRLTITDRIIAYGTLLYLESLKDSDREAYLLEAACGNLVKLLSEAKPWNLARLGDDSEKDDFRSIMDKEYRIVWERLVPETYDKEAVPDLQSVFSDYMGNAKIAKSIRTTARMQY